MSKTVLTYAHRGASGYAVENTFSAFEKAMKLGANGIEIDLQVTKDNVFVVFHDLNLSRLAGINRQVSDCTFDEICQFRIGKRFWRKITNHQIPSFKEVVDWANENQIALNIELKESVISNSQPLIDLIQKLKLPKGSHFSSFHDELMQIVKMQRPEVETAILVTKKINWEELKKMSHIDTVHAHKRYYKQMYFNYCKEANKKMRFYSINGNESFLKSPNPIVIGWITDYPDKVLKKQETNDAL